MGEFPTLLVATGAAFLAIDCVWLGLMVPRLYRPRLGDILMQGMRWRPAIAFYLLYTFGMTYFVAMPALHARAPNQALLNGALLGAVAYGTYNFTSWATLKRWSAPVAYIDIAWGAALTASSCWIGVTLADLLA